MPELSVAFLVDAPTTLAAEATGSCVQIAKQGKFSDPRSGRLEPDVGHRASAAAICAPSGPMIRMMQRSLRFAAQHQATADLQRRRGRGLVGVVLGRERGGGVPFTSEPARVLTAAALSPSAAR
jgi:hypothetical protein